MIDYPVNVAIFLPKKIPIIQQQTLNVTYTPPRVHDLVSNKSKASSENVEKVVNPPHTPVFQNSKARGATLPFLSAIHTLNTISPAPTMFVISVNIGNCVFTGIRLIAYLAIAPSAPPSATNMNPMCISSFNIYCK